MTGFAGWRLGWLSAAAIALLAVLGGNRKAVMAASQNEDLFSSNVVTLNTKNWKKHVLDNPNMVLVNICRKESGNCYEREWEELAESVRGIVTIAYWDTQQQGGPPKPRYEGLFKRFRRPLLLWSLRKTPIARLITPRRKQKDGSVLQKKITDYFGLVSAADFRKFLDQHMPNFVKPIKNGSGDYHNIFSTAMRNGRPLVVAFTNKTKTSTTLKWLSAEYHRKMYFAEVLPTKKNEGLREEIFGLSDKSGGTAKLYVVKPSGAVVAYEGESFARRKVNDFLKKYAPKKPALKWDDEL